MLALSIDIVLGMVEVSVGVPKKRYVPPFDSQYDHKHEVSNHLLEELNLVGVSHWTSVQIGDPRSVGLTRTKRYDYVVMTRWLGISWESSCDH